jgi:hypothetical protein
LQHIVFVFRQTAEAEQKSQKQRAAPTQQRQKTPPEKQPGAKLHNVAL